MAFLWQADGPLQGARGVTDDAGRARRAAADCLRSGAASSAVVEEALPDLWVRTLAGGYAWTGHGWRAKVGAGGRVWWVPLGGGAKAGAA
jgi:hypothetical protein